MSQSAKMGAPWLSRLKTSTWRPYLAANQDQFLDELVDLLRIPRMSSLPEHAPDVARASRWTAERLSAAGMEHAAVLPTARHPVVYADRLHASGKPTVLMYGHVDVQPPDPLDRWTSPPSNRPSAMTACTPAVRDGYRTASSERGVDSGLLA